MDPSAATPRPEAISGHTRSRIVSGRRPQTPGLMHRRPRPQLWGVKSPRCRISRVVPMRVYGPASVRGRCELLAVAQSSFPRRQQARRLRRAAASGAAGLAAGALAATAAAGGAPRWRGRWRWSWSRCCSTLVAGCAWLPAAVSGLGLRTRFDGPSAGWRRRGGGCATRSRVAGAAISTASRSPRPASRSRSRPRRARSTHATWPTPDRRPRGSTGIAGVGVGEERSRCCAWCVPAGWRGSRTGFLWSRLIAWFRFSEPAREPHPGPGSWPRSFAQLSAKRSAGC